MKKLLACTALVPLIAAGAAHARPAGALYPNMGDMRDRPAEQAQNFPEYLDRGYRSLAEFEAQDMVDWDDAELFAAKSNIAATGKVPYPSDPADWDIDDPKAMADLKAGRAQLGAAINAGSGHFAPGLTAQAQVKYDCWVEQQEEGHQPLHIATCRDQFAAAMVALELAIDDHNAPKMSKDTQPMAEPGEVVATEKVYFEFDEYGLTDQAQAKINDMVTTLKTMRNIEMVVEGHADRAGPPDYNLDLSRKRAQTVRDELDRQGMRVVEIDELTIEAEGETEPAVATADGVPEQRNRRVEVTARGAVTDQAAQADEPAAHQQAAR